MNHDQIPRIEAPQVTVAAETLIDAHQFERRVYALHGTSAGSIDMTIIFRGREELADFPDSDTEDAFRSIVLTTDEEPRNVPTREFTAYVSSHAAEVTTGNRFVVSATPVGILDLACKIGGDQVDRRLHSMRANLLAGSFGPQETSYLDMLSAAVYTENPENEVERSDGLVEVALALAGDTEKTADLMDKMSAQAAREKNVIARNVGRDVLGMLLDDEPVAPEIIEQTHGLVMVRTTSNAPETNADGTLIVYPAAQYTRDIRGSDGEAYIPRQTTHFALNHYVQSHLGGNFDGTYTIVAPLDKALVANGRPTVLQGVDTYFTSGPGESVRLPEATIIQAGGNIDQLVQHDGQQTMYKSEGYDVTDGTSLTDALYDQFGKQTHDKYTFENELKSRVERAAMNGGLMTHDPTGTIDYYENNELKTRQGIYVKDMYAKSSDEMLVTLANAFPDKFDGYTAKLVESFVVDAAIRAKGGDVVMPSGTSNYILNEGFDTRITNLAQQLHVRNGLHSGEIESKVETDALDSLYGRKDSQDQLYKWTDMNDNHGERLNQALTVPTCPLRLRRAALESGLLTVASEKARINSKRQAQNPLSMAGLF